VILEIPLFKFIPKAVLLGYAAVFGLWFEGGAFDFKPEEWFNESVPDIKPLTVKQMLDKAWRKRGEVSLIDSVECFPPFIYRTENFH